MKPVFRPTNPSPGNDSSCGCYCGCVCICPLGDPNATRQQETNKEDDIDSHVYETIENGAFGMADSWGAPES